MMIFGINSIKNINFTSSKLGENIREDWRTRCKNNPDEVVFLTKEEPKIEFTRLKFSLNNFLKNLFLKPRSDKLLKDSCGLTIVDYEILNDLQCGTGEYFEEDYKELSPKAIEIARFRSRQAKSIVDESLYYADLLKNELDEKYGANKYIFVCVGRSPSTIARCLEKMNVPVVFCPMSGLRENHFKKFEASKSYNKYLSFLENSGLSKETLNQSQKKLLVYDYTESGDSLKCFGKILLNGLGLDSDKVILRSLNQDINDIAPDKHNASLYIARVCTSCEAEHYGGVPELDWTCAGKPQKARLTTTNQAGYNQFKFALQEKLEHKN